MTILTDLLAALSHRDLRAIATRLGIRVRTQQDKPAWVTAIGQFWLVGPGRRPCLDRLTPAAQQALAALVVAEGVPTTLFLNEYGALRRAGVGQSWQPPPWQAPQTVSEELYYSGLLFPFDGPTVARSQRIGLPLDLRRVLQPLLHEPPALTSNGTSNAAPQTTADPARDLLHDLAQLLMQLHHADVQEGKSPLTAQGRWLRRPQLSVLNRHLMQPDAAGARSHKQAPRRRLLLFFATVAGLQRNGRLQPQGWAWLAAMPSEQIEILWRAWRTAAPSVRTVYAEPDGDLPPPWPEPMITYLAQQRSPATVTQIALALVGNEAVDTGYWAANVAGVTDLAQMVDELCSGSLAMLGVVDAARGEKRAGNEQEESATRYSVTALGRRLLAVDELLLPPAETQGRIAVQTADVWLVHAPVGGAYAAQTRLAGYASGWTLQAAANGEAPHNVFDLQAHSVAQASAAGYGLADLLAALDDLGIALSAEEIAQLATWHGQGQTIRYELLPVLRTKSATEMRQLREQSALRDKLGELLTPTLIVAAAPAAEMASALRQAGFSLDTLSSNAANKTSQQNGDANAALWLAGQVYAMLGQQLPLLLPPPMAALQALFATLGPAEQALLTAQRARLAAQLYDLLDRLSFTPPAQPSDPAQWQPPIEAAITAKDDLQLTYFSAGRNLLVQLRLTPYWITERNSALYVEGYGHEAGHTLTLRLDRIKSLTTIRSDSRFYSANDSSVASPYPSLPLR